MKSLPVAVGIAAITMAPLVNAHGWGVVTHAYIAARLNHQFGRDDPNLMCGAMAPDVFNNLVGLPSEVDLPSYTHSEPYCLQILDAAASRSQRALVYGFICHNDDWGADFTAHHSGRTFGKGKGYVIVKAEALAAIAAMPTNFPKTVALELGHNLVEMSVDVLMRRLDPEIGRKIAAAARNRDPGFPSLLIRSYSADFRRESSHLDVVPLIEGSETSFRRLMEVYGQGLMKDEPAAIKMLAEHLADLAPFYLKARHLAVPPRDEVVAMLVMNVNLAMQLCERDYAKEIAATIRFVDQQLKNHRIKD